MGSSPQFSGGGGESASYSGDKTITGALTVNSSQGNKALIVNWDDEVALRTYGNNGHISKIFRKGGSLNEKIATANVSSLSGASQAASGLIPKGALVMAVGTYVGVEIGDGNGTTGYQVGDGTDPDRWGDKTGLIVGTQTSSADYTTEDAVGKNTIAATDVVITAVGGDFDGNGTIRVVVHYIDNTPPSQM